MAGTLPYSVIRQLLFRLPEESAHSLGLWALRRGFVPYSLHKESIPETLKIQAFGLNFMHPVGLAAGFDKNAEVIAPLFKLGFSFVEAGTVTPKPQSGNPQPRMFRLVEDSAIINRLGFNNKGMDAFEQNFKTQKAGGITGINIGKNKDTTEETADYLTLLERFYGLSDYITINVSSPNTPGLRQLQKREQLDNLLSALLAKRAELKTSRGKHVPLLLKIAPDITQEDQEDIAELALTHQLDGLIISNTTVSRLGLKDKQLANETGGLSGRPVFALSTAILASMYKLTQKKIPIVGVGGIFTAEDAYAKHRAGASLVQVYTGFIYRGPEIVAELCRGLDKLLKKDGFSNISQVIGIDT